MSFVKLKRVLRSIYMTHTVNSPFRAPSLLRIPPVFLDQISGLQDVFGHILAIFYLVRFSFCKKPLEGGNVLYPIASAPGTLIGEVKVNIFVVITQNSKGLAGCIAIPIWGKTTARILLREIQLLVHHLQLILNNIDCMEIKLIFWILPKKIIK